MRPPLESDSPLKSDWPDRPVETPSVKRSSASFLKELPVLILIAFGLALLIKTFLVQAFFIPSESMEPTLRNHDRVLVNKFVYRFREPRRGEIIVFVGEHDVARERRSFLRRIGDTLTEGFGVRQSPDRDFIKRIVGLPGETVEMRDGVVTVTTTGGRKLTLDESYLADEKDLTPFGPTPVPPNSYFVMGDNRPNSSDSRVRGAIKRSDVVGKAFVKVWPLGRMGVLRTPKFALPAGASALVALPLVVRGIRRRRAVPRRQFERAA